MKLETLTNKVAGIVRDAVLLKNAHTAEKNAPVNYACVFCQSDTEYTDLVALTNGLGKVILETPTGPLFSIQPIETVAGQLRLLKIRKPDAENPERGDADFTVLDYEVFKMRYLGTDGFKLIVRPGYEMIELLAPSADVRAYFSNPPLDKQLGLASVY